MEGPFDNVQWLTISELAELWEPELKIPKSVIARELRLGVYKLHLAKEGKANFAALTKPLDVPPTESELPSLDTLIERNFIERFCDKELWAMPSFWQSASDPGPSFPGRPSVMSAVAQELERQAKSGELKATLAEQSRVLADWASHRFPGKQTPKPTSIENGIRAAYRIIKADLAR